MNRKPKQASRLTNDPPDVNATSSIDNDVFRAAFTLGEHGFTITGVDRLSVLYYRHPKTFGLRIEPADLAGAYAEWVTQLINHRERGAAERVECGCTRQQMAWEKINRLAEVSDDRRERLLHQMMYEVAEHFWHNRLFDAREAATPPRARRARLAPNADTLQSLATA